VCIEWNVANDGLLLAYDLAGIWKGFYGHKRDIRNFAFKRLKTVSIFRKRNSENPFHILRVSVF
jgi:hypothetical protein